MGLGGGISCARHSEEGSCFPSLPTNLSLLSLVWCANGARRPRRAGESSGESMKVKSELNLNYIN